MAKRTTIEIDEELLDRAKRALGEKTTRGVVEEALRRASDDAEAAHRRRAGAQRSYLDGLGQRADLTVLGTEVMWR
jgi:Arc/MetJ family transcription regulator